MNREMKLIKQNQSTHCMVKKGTDWSGNKINKKLIKSSLVLETMVKEELGDDYCCINGWSDYQPNYNICKKRTEPKEERKDIGGGYVRINPHTLGNEWEWFSVLEVFPKSTHKGEVRYLVRDSRILKPHNPNWYEDYLIIDELKETILSDYGITTFDFIKEKGGSLGGSYPLEDGSVKWTHTNDNDVKEELTEEMIREVIL